MSEKKISFAVIGSGWRAEYYLRVCKKLPENFGVCAVLCRREEKACEIKAAYGVNAVLSEEELIQTAPDFVVIAIDKAHIARESKKWLNLRFYVLSETPMSTDRDELLGLKSYINPNTKWVFAEQYRRYPENIGRQALVDSGIIGQPDFLYLSVAHDYHAMSLIRSFLSIPTDMTYQIKAKEWSFPTIETLSRYEKFSDGRVSNKKRTTALISFENGKAAIYDFDSEQYRSPIRRNHIKFQGQRGELFDWNLSFLDKNNNAVSENVLVKSHITETNDPNPNFKSYSSIDEISFQGDILYRKKFAQADLSQDEAAIADMLYNMGSFSRGEGASPYSLDEAYADALMAIDLREAVYGL